MIVQLRKWYWLSFTFMLMVSGGVWAELPMAPLTEHSVAPEFTLPDLNGRRHSLSDFRGHLVLVNFWAGWCQPCRKEMPSLQHSYEVLRTHGVQVLAVHAGPMEDSTMNFLKINQITFPILVDRELALKNWAVTRLPTSILISPDGHMIYRISAGRDWGGEPMLAFLRSVLQRYANSGSPVRVQPSKVPGPSAHTQAR